MKASDFFTFPASLAPFERFFASDALPWEWLPQIAAALASWDFSGGLDPAIQVPAGVVIEGPVYLHPSVKLPPYCVITGPVWIGPESMVRPGALIRGNVLVGAKTVLGNACEYKNCLLMDRVETAHYNYVGDSILGSQAHLGAGAICSNLRLDRLAVTVRGEHRTWDTGLRKFGAILAEQAEVGCNAVLNPGSILGKRSLVMPAMAFGGVLPAATIAKGRSGVSFLPRKD